MHASLLTYVPLQETPQLKKDNSPAAINAAALHPEPKNDTLFCTITFTFLINFYNLVPMETAINLKGDTKYITLT